MVIGIIGENCSGKSTLAEEIKNTFGAEIITGKDYLRLAKSENEAIQLFREKLKAALTGKHLIYVISEKSQISLLPNGAIRILVKTDIDTIKERFKARMHGNLPMPVEQMLVRNHGIFDNEVHDFLYDGSLGNPVELCNILKDRI